MAVRDHRAQCVSGCMIWETYELLADFAMVESKLDQNSNSSAANLQICTGANMLTMELSINRWIFVGIALERRCLVMLREICCHDGCLAIRKAKMGVESRRCRCQEKCH